VPDYVALNGNIRGIKLGLPKEYFIGGLDREVNEAVRAAVRRLEELGAEIVEISLPHTEYAVAVYYIVATAEASANLARFDGIRYGLRVDGPTPFDLYCRTRGAGFGAEVKRRIILGTYVLSSGYYDAYYLRAQKVRTLIRQDFAAFEKVDLIVTPTAPTAAFKPGKSRGSDANVSVGYLHHFVQSGGNLWRVCPGVHALAAFADRAAVAGKPLGEETLLRVAHAFEQATPWHKERAPIGIWALCSGRGFA
jgi:aspartyl-tRNA(Asn)/glutamyl-tRNA(Gln) amidotransferase subunit A